MDDDYNDGSARRGEDATSNFAVKRNEDWVVVRKSIGRMLWTIEGEGRGLQGTGNADRIEPRRGGCACI